MVQPALYLDAHVRLCMIACDNMFKSTATTCSQPTLKPQPSSLCCVCRLISDDFVFRGLQLTQNGVVSAALRNCASAGGGRSRFTTSTQRQAASSMRMLVRSEWSNGQLVYESTKSLRCACRLCHLARLASLQCSSSCLHLCIPSALL